MADPKVQVKVVPKNVGGEILTNKLPRVFNRAVRRPFVLNEILELPVAGNTYVTDIYCPADSYMEVENLTFLIGRSVGGDFNWYPSSAGIVGEAIIMDLRLTRSGMRLQRGIMPARNISSLSQDGAPGLAQSFYLQPRDGVSVSIQRATIAGNSQQIMICLQGTRFYVEEK